MPADENFSRGAALAFNKGAIHNELEFWTEFATAVHRQQSG